MMAHFHLYNGNPTSGGTDGAEVSSGTNLNPVLFTLDAAQAETKVAKCAARCDTGYQADGGVRVYVTGASADKWAVANDGGYTSATALDNASWSSEITLTGVSAANVVFWAKATSAADEEPQSDQTVKIAADATIVAVI